MRAAIFDMDGVLIDSEHLHWRAEQETMAEFGVTMAESELKKFAGTRAEVMFEIFIRQYRLPTTFAALYPGHEARLLRLFQSQVRPTDGIQQILQTLAAAAIPLAVASSSSKRLIQAALQQTGLAGYFKAVVSGAEVPGSKPAPDIFLEAARRLGLPPESCVVFEDSLVGVQSAKAAGMYCVGYENPNNLSVRLEAADRVIQDWSELNLEAIFTFDRTNT